MLQATMVKPGKICFENVGMPKVESGYLLLKIGEIGICGSDIHVYHGKHPYTTYPVIQGHEFSAEIAAVGPGVTGFHLGQTVTVEPSMTCGECYSCRHGRYNICDRLKVMGFQTDGAAREYFTVPAGQVIPLPEGFKRPLAALIEPLAVAVHAVCRMGKVSGGRFLVLGAGPIGNLVAQVIRAFGGTVLITDVNPFRLNLAVKCDLKNVVKADDSFALERVKQFFGVDGPDGIFECVGAQATIEQAVKLARKGSRIMIVGVFGEKPQLDLGLVQDRELELVGSLMYQRPDFIEAIRLVREEAVKVGKLVTHTFKFEDYDKAYRTIMEQPEWVMKVLIEVERK